MSKPLDLDNIDTTQHDDDEDLSKLDRGDGLTDADRERPEEQEEEEEEADAQKAARERDESGKFVKKGGKADGGEQEEEEEAEEEEEEEEETPEQKAAREAAEAEAKDDKNLSIRLRKALDQRDLERAERIKLQERLEAVEKRLNEAAAAKEEPKVDPVAELNAKLDDLYEKVEEARADGDTKAAAQLQREIDKANREITRIEATQVTQKLTAEQRENMAYDAFLDALEAADPRVVQGSEEFDEKLVAKLNKTVAGYERLGMRPTEALREAAELVLGYEPGKPKAKEQPAQKDEPKPLVRKTDVKKAIDNSQRQPPDTSTRGVSKDDTKIDPAALSDEEWDKLPEATKKKMRGDFGA